MNKKVLLVILDGYGLTKDAKDNAVSRSNSPFLHKLLKENSIKLKASGKAVGLPEGVVGNSEVGHFTIGCGQILNQSLVRINNSIQNNDFYNIKKLNDKLIESKNLNSNIHVTCLLSDAGIHGQINHLRAICKLLKSKNITNFYFHGILDGRDVPQKSAVKFIELTQRILSEEKIGTFASICGRFFAMDRDKNYERTKVFYNLLTNPNNCESLDLDHNLNEKISDIYLDAENDYYVKAYKLVEFPGLSNQDLFINMNYRTDRQEQITQAFEDKKFNYFENNIKPNLITFGDYGSKINNIFPTPKINKNLSTILAEKKLKQARIAETEKFAHVTFFFNSQVKTHSDLETHYLIPSSKIANYKDDPNMQAEKITSKAIEISEEQNSLVVINYANPDLVGHSGDLKATKESISFLDKNLKRLTDCYLKKDYTILISADHGNAEDMENPDGTPNPSHTINQVPLIILSNIDLKVKEIKNAGLKDIAPTILKLLEIDIPKEFDGESLI